MSLALSRKVAVRFLILTAAGFPNKKNKLHRLFLVKPKAGIESVQRDVGVAAVLANASVRHQ